MNEVSVGENFWTSGHYSISFKIVTDKDRAGQLVNIPNWGKSNFDGIRQEVVKVDWSRLFAGKGKPGKWDAFTSMTVRAQDMHVPVRVKGKAGSSKGKLG